MMSRMGNIGGGEIIFIAIFALLVFGPKRLPEIGRSVGKALGELRRATNDLKSGFTEGFEDLRDPLFLDGPVKPVKRVAPETPATGSGATAPPDPAAPPAALGEDGTSTP
jgi:sec-independent protein translocase protein TatA